MDDVDTPYNDTVIETALKGFGVEVFDWMKLDICSETIFDASPEVQEIVLYSSGNRAVLRSWSGEDGLIQLRKVSCHHSDWIHAS